MSDFSYECFCYKQRNDDQAPQFCIFTAPVGEILKWADIKRLHDEDSGPQRRTSKAKVNSIAKYLEKESRNTIPTSIVLTIDQPGIEFDDIILQDGSTSETMKSLNITPQEGGQKPGLIIDGQHRLLGIAKFNEETKVNVVALVNTDDAEKAFQFLVINNKASKVSTDHIRALALEYQEDELSDRLQVVRLTLHPNVGLVGMVDTEDDSPFKGIIKLPIDDSAERIIVPASIENSLAYIQQQKLKQFDNEDILMEFYYAIWGTIKENWSDIWTIQSKLLKKVGIISMTEYMTDSLIASYDLGILDISDPDSVKESVKKLLDNHERAFWTTGWTSTSYDTRAGRELIKNSLIRVARNIRAQSQWYEDLEIIDIGDTE